MDNAQRVILRWFGLRNPQNRMVLLPNHEAKQEKSWISSLILGVLILFRKWESGV
jgi:hypothetical protein